MTFQSRSAHLLLRSILAPKSSSGVRSFFSNRVIQHEVNLRTKSLYANFFTTCPLLRRTSNTTNLLQKRYVQRNSSTPKRNPPSPKQYIPPRQNRNRKEIYPNATEHHYRHAEIPEATGRIVRRRAELKSFSGKLVLGLLVATSVTIFALKIHVLPAPKFIKDIDLFLQENFVLSQYNLGMGRWWTYITHTFNHGSIGHLAFNMISLWSFGSMTTSFFGGRGVLLFYIVGGIAGGVASIQLLKNGSDAVNLLYGFVGASGSCLSLMSGMAVLFPRMRIGIIFLPFGAPAWAVTIAFAAYSWYAENNGLERGTGHYGHLGGMAAGALLGLVFRMRLRMR